MASQGKASANNTSGSSEPPKTKVDEDGVVLVWDSEKRAYFPQVPEENLIEQQAAYGNDDAWVEVRDEANKVTFYRNSVSGLTRPTPPPNWEQIRQRQLNSWYQYMHTDGVTPYYYNTITQETVWTLPPGATATPAYEQSQDDTVQASPAVASSAAKPSASATNKQSKKGTKRKAEGTEPAKDADDLVTLDDDKNPHVYVENLPPDVTEEELEQFMSKCGIIALDEYEQKRVKVYRDEHGNPKGDGRVTYHRVESVALAFQILDGSEIRPGFEVKLSRAVFKKKKEGELEDERLQRKRRELKKKNAQKVTQKLLGWYDEGLKSKKALGVIVLKHMFRPEEIDQDPLLLDELKRDVEQECAKFGPIKKVNVYDRNPAGVITIRYVDPESSGPCIATMNGRWFGGRKIEAYEWDGKESFKVEETEEEKQRRLAQWDKFLEDGQ